MLQYSIYLPPLYSLSYYISGWLVPNSGLWSLCWARVSTLLRNEMILQLQQFGHAGDCKKMISLGGEGADINIIWMDKTRHVLPLISQNYETVLIQIISPSEPKRG